MMHVRCVLCLALFAVSSCYMSPAMAISPIAAKSLALAEATSKAKSGRMLTLPDDLGQQAKLAPVARPIVNFATQSGCVPCARLKSDLPSLPEYDWVEQADPGWGANLARPLIWWATPGGIRYIEGWVSPDVFRKRYAKSLPVRSAAASNDPFTSVAQILGDGPFAIPLSGVNIEGVQLGPELKGKVTRYPGRVTFQFDGGPSLYIGPLPIQLKSLDVLPGNRLRLHGPMGTWKTFRIVEE